MARKIVVANLKGGVGKTNVCVNLCMFLSALGKRVLLVDLSPQGDATFSLGIKKSPHDVGDVLLQRLRPGAVIKSTPYFGYDIMPCFSDTSQELINHRKPELRLKMALEGLEEDYDFIIIDTSPGLDIFCLNALEAADELIVPVQAEYLALRSVKKLLNRKTFKKFNILITMYGWRSRVSRNIVKRARKEFSGHVLNTIIPRAAILAQESIEPILKTAPNSRAARAYKQLAEEVTEQ